MEPPGNLSSEPEFLVTTGGNLRSHEPTDLFLPVAVAWHAHPRRHDTNAGLGRGGRRLSRTMPDVLVWHKEGFTLTRNYQEKSNPILKMAIEFIL